MSFEIKSDKYSGPFDLLLELIEGRKLLVNEISLSKVTDDFIAYLESNKNLDLSENAHFILVATTLVLIKSKSLLPSLELNQEEQGDIKSLETRLAIYKIIKEAGLLIHERFDKVKLFAPAQRNFYKTIFLPGKINSEMVADSIRRVLAQIPKIENLPKVVVKKVISLEEMISTLTNRVQNCLKINFHEFSAKDKTEKINVIVGFLAMLELVKRGIIRVEQKATFHDIEMETQSINIPKYN